DSNSVKLNQAKFLSSITADWRYSLPNNATDPAGPAGHHPILYVAGNSGVYQSLDDGQTWTLFPHLVQSDTTFDAVADRGNPPPLHIPARDLSLGTIGPTTGMPSLAGPYQTFLFSGTLATDSTSVTGINNLAGLVAGESVAGPGIPAGTTIVSVSKSTRTITL